MTTVQPIRHFMLRMAGKVISGEPITESEAENLAAFKRSFPDLVNPRHVRCSIPEHRSYGAVVFPDEVIKDAVVGNIREDNGRWICTACGNGDNVRDDEVRVL